MLQRDSRIDRPRGWGSGIVRPDARLLPMPESGRYLAIFSLIAIETDPLASWSPLFLRRSVFGA